MENVIPDASEKSTSQQPILELFKSLGYKYISEDENKRLRDNNLNKVLFEEILAKKLDEINRYEYKGVSYHFSPSTIGQAIKDLNVNLLTGLISTNEKIYDMLTYGKSYEEILFDGSKRSFDFKFIDFDNPTNNDFYVTEEFAVKRQNENVYDKDDLNQSNTARPDIVLFINGIPVVTIECKNVDETIEQGISQTIRNQKPEYIPQLFKFIQIVMSIKMNDAKYATVGTPAKFWTEWKEEELDWQNNILDKIVTDRQVTKQDRDIVSLFEKNRLMEIIHDYIIFDEGTKKVCRHQQFFATRAIIDKIKNKHEGGVVWHTQGSGKSITMVYTTRKLMSDPTFKNTQIVLVTDRVYLDKQLNKTFNHIGLEAKRANTGEDLKKFIEDPNVRIISTIVNKFVTAVNKGTQVNAENTIILVDEGHRTEYGEFNRRMREVFKDAIYVSFTGTPVMKKEKDTFRKFGGLIHKYSLDDALADKEIVPLIYEGRMVDQEVTKQDIDRRLDLITRNMTENQKRDVMSKWSRFEKVASSQRRIELIAFDIAEHYKETLYQTEFNAMLATNSKYDAIRYYKIFQDEFPELNVAYVITAPDDREGEDDFETETSDIVKQTYNRTMQNYKDADEYEELIKSKFIHGDIDILIVVDKLLTGFDAPRASTLYLDKHLKEHGLLQAIARVNRLYEGKDYGLIVDYRGLLGNLKDALTMYKDVGLEGFETEDVENSVYYIDNEIDKLYEAHNDLVNIFSTIKNKDDFEEYCIFLEDEKIRKDFYDKLCKFGSSLNLIYNSDTGYYKVGKDTLNQYKREFNFYQKLRENVKIRYSEKVDHREYEAKMQKLLDDDVIATDIMKITEPVEISDNVKFEEEVAKMSTKRGKADTIRTRMEKTIIEKAPTDPAYYKKFSERIEETISDYRAKRISDDEYFKRMQEIYKDYKNGDSGIKYPSNVNEDTRAFYGVLYDEFIKQNKNIDIEKVGTIANTMDSKIKEKIKRDWHTNIDVHNQIREEIDDLLFTMGPTIGIQVDIDMMDVIEEKVLQIALRKYSDK